MNNNILFNNSLVSDSWNKRISCEQLLPINSPVGITDGVITLRPISSKIFIFSYEDNAPLIQNKDYAFSIYVNVEPENDSYSLLIEPSWNPDYNEEYYLDQNCYDLDEKETINTSSSTVRTITDIEDKTKTKNKEVQMALFKGRYFNEKNIITQYNKINEEGTWINLKWNFKITKDSQNNQRISFYIKHTKDKIISLWKPELFCISGIYDIQQYKNFDFFKMPINLFNEYKNNCVNIFTGIKDKNLTGFFIGPSYICSVYERALLKEKVVYAQIFPNASIVALTLIGYDTAMNIAIYTIQTQNPYFFIFQENVEIFKTMLMCTINRQYSTTKHQIKPGFITSLLNQNNINDSFYSTTFEKSNTTPGQPIISPDGNLIGMVSKLDAQCLCVNVKILNKICTKITKAYEKNKDQIPLELNGSFLGIQYHYASLIEKNNLKISDREVILIDKVYSNSPAYDNGLKEGDIIFNFSKNNTPLYITFSFFEYIYTKKPNSTIVLQYSKNYNIEEKITIEINLGSRNNFILKEDYL